MPLLSEVLMPLHFLSQLGFDQSPFFLISLADAFFSLFIFLNHSLVSTAPVNYEKLKLTLYFQRILEPTHDSVFPSPHKSSLAPLSQV